MRNILDTELISNEQMLSLIGGSQSEGDSCKSCTQTQKNYKGDGDTSIGNPTISIPLN